MFWEVNYEGGSFAWLAGSLDFAPMGIDNGFGDGESQSIAAVGLGPRLITAVKALENLGEVNGRNAWAGIVYLQADEAVFGSNFSLNLAMLGVILEGVGQQVGDDLGKTGEYVFRTIKPVPYPGRTPHIHYKIRVARQGRRRPPMSVEVEIKLQFAAVRCILSVHCDLGCG